MSELLKSDQKKIELLKILADGKVYTYYHLSKIAKTNYETVKKNLSFLELLNLVEVIKVDREESASGAASYRVKITEKGLEFVESLK
ncbi:hypothetical protein DRP05_07180 [Archaeoglobales archaeon]|nr:MAG: hypothetical protein DRP05_07180 [Archaeoglobales archaeon]